VSQQENALAAVNDQLTAARQDNQQLRFQLDDTLRRAADEREGSVMHATSVVIMQQCCFHLLSLHTRAVFCAVAIQQANSIIITSLSVHTGVCSTCTTHFSLFDHVLSLYKSVITDINLHHFPELTS